MSKARLIFVVGFVLALGAGVVVGMVAARVPVKAAATRGGMDADLGLTPEQAEQVHAIWSAVGERDHGRSDRRRALNKERDEEILKLIPGDRRLDYDRIQQEHAAKVAEANKEHERLIQDAEQKMKIVLTETQWKRFEDVKRERAERWKKSHPATAPNEATSNPTLQIPATQNATVPGAARPTGATSGDVANPDTKAIDLRLAQ